jgi:predicted secreted protein
MPWNSKLLILIIWMLCSQVFASCQQSDRVSVTEKNGHCTNTDSGEGEVVRVRVGDTLIVRLPVIPATGAVWHFANSEVLKEKERTKYELLEQGKPGAKAKQVFQFMVKKHGQHTLLFTLDRGKERISVCTFRLDARR